MKGICFIEPLFNAVVEGKKTQTRRIIKTGDDIAEFPLKDGGSLYSRATGFFIKELAPRYKIGETLYLKEPYFVSKNKSISFLSPAYKYGSILSEEDINSTKWENKLFMPEKYARYFIKITGVRWERLQDISDEDILIEGIFDWLRDWAWKNAACYEEQHWIEDLLDGCAQGLYCKKCAKKEVKRIKKEYREKGYTKEDVENNIFIASDGSAEEDSIAHCQDCGKPLEYSFIGNFDDYFSDEQLKYLDFDKETAYLLDNSCFDEEDIIKYKGFLRKAYAASIDKIYGKDIWENNPYVWVYDFELIKREN